MPSHVSRRQYAKSIGAGALLATVAGCLGDDNGTTDEADIQIATPFGPQHTQSQLASRFLDNLEDDSDERFTGELLAASIGGEEDQIEAVAGGSIEMQGTSMASLTEAHADEYGFLEAPFVVESWEHLLNLMDEYVYADGELNDTLSDEANQRIIGESFRGLRGTTSNFPVREPADVQGIDIRLPEFETWVNTWEEIGANATPVSFDELYSALETGVVEASEGPIQQFMDTSLYEVQTHFSETDHLLQSFQWLVNEEFWNSLSEEDQELFVGAVDEAADWANQQTEDEVEELLDTAQDEHGTEIVFADEVDQDAFFDAGAPSVEAFFNETWGPSLEDVRDLA